jgi:ABC-type oligopeptide transport system ATPase subunit
MLEGRVVAALLELDRVSKVFRTGMLGGGKPVAATRNVSFEIDAGQVVSLIGESGSGKTTIGRMILRLARASGGTITFDGKDVGSLDRHGLKSYYGQVQGVFQDPFSSYNPIFTTDHVFELLRDVYFRRLSTREWRQKVAESIGAVSLDPSQVLGKYPHQLSGGQLQRLLIARALLLEIRLLIADEIISMLDASTRVDVLNLLGDLRSRGLSVMLITHDLSLGHYISDRAVILRRGMVVEAGPTDRVFENPLHPYTQMLLASVPTLGERWADEISPNGAELAGEWDVHDRIPDDPDDAVLVEAAPGHFVARAAA